MDGENIIKDKRKRLGMTQEEFAEAFGLTRDRVANMELGRPAKIPLDLLDQIDKLLKPWEPKVIKLIRKYPALQTLLLNLDDDLLEPALASAKELIKEIQAKVPETIESSAHKAPPAS